MKCPMTFGDPCADRNEECRPDCAWLCTQGGNTFCSVPGIASTIARTVSVPATFIGGRPVDEKGGFLDVKGGE